MTFGEKLQRLRVRKGLSQDALAELLDVSRQAVSKWERDETMPEAEKIIRISDCFQVTTDYLLKDGPERFPERGHSLPDPGRSGTSTAFCWAGRWRSGPCGAASGWCRWCFLPATPGGKRLRPSASITVCPIWPCAERRCGGTPVAPGGGPPAIPCGPGAGGVERPGTGGRCGGLLIGWLSRQAEDIVVTQKEHSAGLVWFVLYGVVLAAGVLLCRRRKEQDP